MKLFSNGLKQMHSNVFLIESHQFQVFFFVFLITNIKILFNFEKEWCIFNNGKGRLKNNYTHNCLEHAKILLKYH
jgi:hypothetical protein